MTDTMTISKRSFLIATLLIGTALSARPQATPPLRHWPTRDAARADHESVTESVTDAKSSL